LLLIVGIFGYIKFANLKKDIENFKLNIDIK
jgi:hypothetical protein